MSRKRIQVLIVASVLVWILWVLAPRPSGEKIMEDPEDPDMRAYAEAVERSDIPRRGVSLPERGVGGPPENQPPEAVKRPPPFKRVGTDFPGSESPVIEVSGLVLNSYDRTPVSYAQITFSAEAVDFAPVEATASRDGVFRVRLRRAEAYVTRAAAEGFWDYRNPGISFPRSHGRVRILMDPIHVLTGHILDERKRPVANADIRLTRKDRGLQAFGGPDGSSFRSAGTTSDASGYFEKVLPPGEWMVAAAHMEFDSRSTLTISFPEEDHVTLYLRQPAEPRFGSVVGQVLDSRGMPVPQASVSLFAPEAPGKGASTLGDSRGRFAFNRVVPGRYRLLPVKEGYPVPPLNAWQQLEVETDKEYFVELTLPEGIRVEGVVLSHAGTPVDRAIVTLDKETATGGWSDSDGRFRFGKGVPPGRYGIQARHPDYRIYRGTLSVPRDVEMLDLTLVLEEGLTFRGTLNTARNMPIERFTLVFLDPSTGDWLQWGEFTDQDGGFLVRGLEPRTYQLVVTAANEEPVAVVLHLDKSLSALVLLEDSDKAPQVRVIPLGP